jgi:hypothetical protein
MTPNLRTADRAIRIAAGLPIMVLGGSGLAGSALGVVMIVVGSALLITGMAEYCPLYRWLGRGAAR